MGLFDRIKDFLAGDAGPAPAPLPPVTARLAAPAPGTAETVAALGLPNVEPVLPEVGEQPVAWLIEAPADGRELWCRLVEQFPSTGLWPLITDGHDGDIDRPWRDRELDGPGTEIGDARVVLTRSLADYAGEDDEEVPGEPWRRTPGAPASATREQGPVDLPAPFEVQSLLLVPVTRPADAPAQLGWWGPCNYGLTGGDVSAVLRSWEDRFGAVLVGIGFDTLTLHVDAPPAGENATRLAQEWFAFCPDAIDQGVESIQALAELAHERIWWFWWD
ncbi:DUF4253 domain-containing protein [Propioniciclava coleopterorum]|uniref:DUF4253 domain-containing protein n=1 Tax=Propioniciclava coleopterorum TaxID=2714937 RepID=A0A6G7Y5L4_9ACTN|nr:DUF4253 domain-containing protein [Propioniciclava coleopterorum]QIK72105.1 DUF4253 domain-containing protein [Propioniciclava coleopterorum]